MINTRNPEPFEMIGSKDLRESFKDGNIRGSFFINGIEMHQFEANSPASVVSQINAKTGAHFVTAEIDDGGHLVLSDASGHPIVVHAGAAYVNAAPASTGDAAKDVLNALKSESEKQKKDGDGGNKVLELLGLDDTGTDDAEASPQPGFETGRSAEDRRKVYEDGLNNPAIGPTGGARKGDVPQIASNPTPGSTGGSQGRLDDGRGRTGTGGGSGEALGANVEAAHEGGGAGQRSA
jgi:hypothetical protein